MNNNNQIKNDLLKLKKKRKKFKDDTYSEDFLRKKLGLTTKEISKIVPVIKYGLTRYTRENIFEVLSPHKNKVEIFLALDSSQSSFMPPVNKKGQAKLAFKKVLNS